MNIEIFLIIIMVALAIIELGLIFSIRRLTNVLLDMNDKIKRFEDLVNKISKSIVEIGNKIGLLENLKNSKFHVNAKTQFGVIEGEIELGKKD